MAHTLKLLLIENVDNTGIVGDVVTVRKGFARNFLLPRGLATQPSEERVKELAAKRAEAQKELAELRKHREQLTAKLASYSLTMIRSCNDQGILYGAVVQQDICDELTKAGFVGIKPREVRLGQTIKRVDHYEIHVKFDSDLDAVIKLDVKADRKLDLDKRDAEGEKPEGDAAAKGEGTGEAKGEETKGEGAGEAKKGDAKKHERKDRPSGDKPRGDRPEGSSDRREDRPRRDDRMGRRDMISKFDAASLEVTKGWGAAKAAPAEGAAPVAGGDSAAPKDGGKKGEKAAKGDKGKKK